MVPGGGEAPRPVADGRRRPKPSAASLVLSMAPFMAVNLSPPSCDGVGAREGGFRILTQVSHVSRPPSGPLEPASAMVRDFSSLGLAPLIRSSGTVFGGWIWCFVLAVCFASCFACCFALYSFLVHWQYKIGDSSLLLNSPLGFHDRVSFQHHLPDHVDVLLVSARALPVVHGVVNRGVAIFVLRGECLRFRLGDEDWSSVLG